MHVMSAVPGQTGCLAVRVVPVSAPRRSKKIQVLKRAAAQQRAAVAEIDEPHFSGGSRTKALLADGAVGVRYDDCRDETPKNAKNKRKNPTRRITIRRDIRPQEPRKSSLADLLDDPPNNF